MAARLKITYFLSSQDQLKRPPLDFGPVHNDPRCGLSATRRNVAQRRIVGGSEAGFGTFPWQAYIRVGKLISLSRLCVFFVQEV